ncbi:hypothetical protein [Endozoicomonas sp. 4G]|uniref:phage head-tail joining protein n=1 Tax=Endozoicomonas sp. 4G TaxID=2872754 RepID=UPI00207878F5|nr:hypothetical protein [Endozoicomonas sp. 4G]
MPYTTEDRDRLRAALTGGEMMVKFADGRLVQYRSVSEIRQALALVDSELDAASGQRRPAAFRVNVSKGV